MTITDLIKLINKKVAKPELLKNAKILRYNETPFLNDCEGTIIDDPPSEISGFSLVFWCTKSKDEVLSLVYEFDKKGRYIIPEILPKGIEIAILLT